ncbi:MAG: hypothetical protein ACREPK_01155 [Rhodanobacteraceae bacterium]
MISAVLSRISAVVLLVAGLVLLFAPDVVLPAIVSGFPVAAAWLGQLLAGAWLGVATLNWVQRSTTLGGIYGRPTVFANLVLYFISTLSLLRALVGHGAPPILWLAVAVGGALAAAYAALLLRGPFAPPERSAS